MRVLLLSTSTLAHGFGGMETHLEGLSRTLAETGNEVVVITAAHPRGRNEEVRDGVRTRFLPVEPRTYSKEWWRHSRAAVREARLREPPDLVFSISAAGAAVAQENSAPMATVAYGEPLRHLLSAWHDCDGWLDYLDYPRRAAGLLRHAHTERRLWRRSEWVVATDRQLYDRLRRRGYRTVLNYNGVDVERFRPDPGGRRRTRGRLGLDPGAVLALMAGTVNRQKGVWVGVEAMAHLAHRCPGLRLLVVGDGPDRPRLEGRAVALGIGERVRFLGAVDHSEMAPLYAAGDLLWFPTRREEGLPLAIAEALSSGLPVLASHRGGIGSAVRHGRNGLLLGRSPDPRELATATAELLADPERLGALSRHAREFAVQELDQRLLTARLLDAVAPGP